MRTRTLAAAAAATCAIAGVAFTTTTSAQDPGPRTVSFTTDERETVGTFGLDDIKPTSRAFKFTAGDHFGFSSPIVDKPRGKRIGTLHGTCMATAKGPAGFGKTNIICTVIYQVPGGTLSATALAVKGKLRPTAVGGTGIYNGARGEGTVTEERNYSTDTYTLLP